MSVRFIGCRKFLKDRVAANYSLREFLHPGIVSLSPCMVLKLNSHLRVRVIGLEFATRLHLLHIYLDFVYSYSNGFELGGAVFLQPRL